MHNKSSAPLFLLKIFQNTVQSRPAFAKQLHYKRLLYIVLCMLLVYFDWLVELVLFFFNVLSVS